MSEDPRFPSGNTAQSIRLRIDSSSSYCCWSRVFHTCTPNDLPDVKESKIIKAENIPWLHADVLILNTSSPQFPPLTVDNQLFHSVF